MAVTRLKTGKELDVLLLENSFSKVIRVTEELNDTGSFVLRTIEIKQEPYPKSLGFYFRVGDGLYINNRIFVSRVTLGGFVERNGLLSVGDEIVEVNGKDVTQLSQEKVAVLMQEDKRKIVLKVRMKSFKSIKDLTRLRRRSCQFRNMQLPPTPNSERREHNQESLPQHEYEELLFQSPSQHETRDKSTTSTTSSPPPHNSSPIALRSRQIMEGNSNVVTTTRVLEMPKPPSTTPTAGGEYDVITPKKTSQDSQQEMRFDPTCSNSPQLW